MNKLLEELSNLPFVTEDKELAEKYGLILFTERDFKAMWFRAEPAVYVGKGKPTFNPHYEWKYSIDVKDW